MDFVHSEGQQTTDGVSSDNHNTAESSITSSQRPSAGSLPSDPEGSLTDDHDAIGEVTEKNDDHHHENGSDQEHDEIRRRRREKRLAMNRKSARERRKRKRLLIEELQENVSRLTAVNNDLTSANARLRAQVAQLKQQLAAATYVAPSSFGPSAAAALETSPMRTWNQSPLAALAMASFPQNAIAMAPRLPAPVDSSALLGQLQLQQRRAGVLLENDSGCASSAAAGALASAAPSPGSVAQQLQKIGIPDGTQGSSVMGSRGKHTSPTKRPGSGAVSSLPPKKRERN